MFAADLPSPDDERTLASAGPNLISTFIEPESAHPVQVFARQIRGPEGLEVHWNYDELFPNGDVVRHERREQFFLRGPERMTTLVQQAGFSQVEFFGDYRGGPLTARSAAYLVIATR